MIIAAGRGKLRQISLQGHQGPLAHLYFHSHTPSLCYTHARARAHRHTHNCTRSGGERRNVSREEKKTALMIFKVIAGPFRLFIINKDYNDIL